MSKHMEERLLGRLAVEAKLITLDELGRGEHTFAPVARPTQFQRESLSNYAGKCHPERMDVDVTLALLRRRATQRQRAQQERALRVRVAVEQAVQAILPASARAWLIGSLAWGGFQEHSDIDLVIQGVPAELALRLERAIVRSTQVELDILELDDLPASFRQRVREEGVLIRGT